MNAMPSTQAGTTEPAKPVGTMGHSHIAIVIRSALYNVLFYVNIIVLMVLNLPMLLGNRHVVLGVARLWARTSLWLLRIVCGTRVEFRGVENLPQGAFILAAKHQSFLETFALALPVRDFSYVLKRELMWIPLFGWYLQRAGQTGIDRGSARAALIKTVEAARTIFSDGRALFIFPEGTRRPVDAPAVYKNGVGFIYEKCSVPCVPVALNTGLFWPRRRFLRFPGTCVIEILPAIPPGLGRDALATVLQERIETRTHELLAEARAKSPWLLRYAAPAEPV